MNARPTGILDLAATVKDDSHLLQTNLEMTIPERFITGEFSIFPACIFQGTCVSEPVVERTVRPQVPGRAVMSLIHQYLRPSDNENVSLGDMTLTVEIGRPSCLDHLFRDSVSEIDFREEGFGTSDYWVRESDRDARPRSPSSQDEGFMRRKRAKRGVYD